MESDLKNSCLNKSSKKSRQLFISDFAPSDRIPKNELLGIPIQQYKHGRKSLRVSVIHVLKNQAGRNASWDSRSSFDARMPRRVFWCTFRLGTGRRVKMLQEGLGLLMVNSNIGESPSPESKTNSERRPLSPL